MVEFAYNNRIHSSTHKTPFHLGTEPICPGVIEAATDFITWMQKTSEEAQSALCQAAKDMAHHYDAHRTEAPEYAIGDSVWLDAHKDRKSVV